MTRGTTLLFTLTMQGISFFLERAADNRMILSGKIHPPAKQRPTVPAATQGVCIQSCEAFLVDYSRIHDAPVSVLASLQTKNIS